MYMYTCTCISDSIYYNTIILYEKQFFSQIIIFLIYFRVRFSLSENPVYMYNQS